MKIALFGYGKMGKEIEAIAIERGHEIIAKISIDNIAEISPTNYKDADAAIEFTQPDAVIENINRCFNVNLPVVVGTTGWYHNYPAIEKRCKTEGQTMLCATNFSIGVNIFFDINKRLAKLMNNYPQYQVTVNEIHHTQKLDAPSGTAITIGEGIIQHLKRKKSWVNELSLEESILPITSERIAKVPGTHSVTYSSEIDEIYIKHTAHNRKGFALGAVIAAEFIHNKKGVFNMQDVLNIN